MQELERALHEARDALEGMKYEAEQTLASIEDLLQKISQAILVDEIEETQRMEPR